MDGVSRRLMTAALAILITLYIALVILSLFSDRLIFQPQPSSYHDDAFPGGNRVVKLRSAVKHGSGSETDVAEISAVFLPNPRAKYTLIFSHGNAEDIGDDAPFLEELHDAGFAVLAYDYRGYGTSEGSSSEATVYADADAAYRFVSDELRVPADRIISMGRSLGCGAAVELAIRHKVGGLVLESPFRSAFRVLTRVTLLPWDKFNNEKKITKIHVPVLIFHGRRDGVVPFAHGERLLARANEPKRFVTIENAGHNDLVFVGGRRYFEEVRQFAASLQ